VHSHGGLTPEEWRGEVDGHSFYFRERHDEWRIEVDLRPSGRFIRAVCSSGERIGQLVASGDPEFS
jgi:hypothetical protein